MFNIERYNIYNREMIFKFAQIYMFYFSICVFSLFLSRSHAYKYTNVHKSLTSKPLLQIN